MQKYCLGFMFDTKRDFVILIEKKRPKWQEGKLNGVGGHVEEGETSIAAMVREFKEETDVQTKEGDWKLFSVLESQNEGWSVECFKAFKNVNIKTMTDEKVFFVNINDGLTSIIDASIISNLRWLIQMALDNDQFVATVKYRGQA